MSDSAFINKEAYGLLCDKLLGSGMSREVYSSKLLPDCVIKVEVDAGRFQNIVEWETWQRVKETEHSRWFAACRWISASGSVLVMERTRPAGMSDFPERMPAYLCDFKRTNFGLSQMNDPKTGKPSNVLVCHDYGTNLLFEHGMTKRMRKSEWWDAE